MVLHGIDISAWQPDLNFAAVPRDFAFVKSSGGPSYVNPHFYRQAAEAGGRVGAYHFARDGWSGTTADEEVDHFLRTIAGMDVLPVLDWEDAALVHDVAWAHRFLTRVIEGTGRTPLIYMNLSVATSYNWTPVRDLGVKLWLAFYGDDSGTNGYQPPRSEQGVKTLASNSALEVAIWQYTQHGRLPGYGADLDLNVAYTDPWAGREKMLIEGINLKAN